MQQPADARRIRPVLFDVGLAFVVGLLACLGTIGANNGHPPATTAFVLIGLSALPLTVRRRWPEVTLLGSMAALWAYLSLGYPEGPIWAVPAVAVFSYAFVRSVKTTAIVLLALLAATTVFHYYRFETESDFATLAFITLVWLGVPAAGGTITSEARRNRSLARNAERERYKADERVEMAREIHDVVGHSLAVVSLNAGVALHVLAKRPGIPPEAVENLQAIRDASNRALQDLRATLAPLRQGRQLELRPTGAIGDIPSLVDGVRKGGLAVDCTVTGDPDAVPANIAATAYRLVQESLTNVIRHAEATGARVRIDCGPDRITLSVEDDGRGGPVDPDRLGQGITGMMERVRAAGGVFTAAPGIGGGFAVEADLPYGYQKERA